MPPEARFSADYFEAAAASSSEQALFWVTPHRHARGHVGGCRAPLFLKPLVPVLPVLTPLVSPPLRPTELPPQELAAAPDAHVSLLELMMSANDVSIDVLARIVFLRYLGIPH
ncbi:hypothetical protein HPB47_005683 [Ixodes persulcatus]|uniref:Uncharacterized protein n=1 Tax=Ixodes persulcatus TaxID=34615 RepID=A0AC60PCD7_IXOPE|nr:hypothetical protein HPB47_005683 [Ixodes persulcatus]